uniref:Fructose-bisphosphate aldolase B n=1 Tax=Lygus hesperus TaxID=30085 RepID=A0A0A9XIY3_LYGHE
MEVTSTSRGKQALVFDGFRYRCHRKTEKCTSWVCVNDKKSRCPGSLKTTPNLTILSRTSHICTEVGTIEQEVIAKKEQCRKRAREELSVPVHVIFREEFGELKDRGYDFVGHLPNYESMKSSLCSIRRKALGAEQNMVAASRKPRKKRIIESEFIENDPLALDDEPMIDIPSGSGSGGCIVVKQEPTGEEFTDPLSIGQLETLARTENYGEIPKFIPLKSETDATQGDVVPLDLEEDDLLYFKSLAPDLAYLTPDLKEVFRIKVRNILKELSIQ